MTTLHCSHYVSHSMSSFLFVGLCLLHSVLFIFQMPTYQCVEYLNRHNRQAVQQKPTETMARILTRYPIQCVTINIQLVVKNFNCSSYYYYFVFVLHVLVTTYTYLTVSITCVNMLQLQWNEKQKGMSLQQFMTMDKCHKFYFWT